MSRCFIADLRPWSALVLGVSLVLVSGGCSKAEGVPGGEASNLIVPERAGIFVEAIAHYGPLVVRPGDFYAVADERPWSGYWFPLKDDILVAPSSRNGQQSPLAKLDRYSREALDTPVSSVDEEVRDGLYNPSAEAWEGRCGAWAVASVMEPEPVLPPEGVQLPGTDVTFYTRDLKALLTKSYETVDNSVFHRYGQPYTGAPGDDYQDIYPDQFHRVLQAELFKRHRPLIIDDDAGVEVWNTPLWEAMVSVRADGSDARVMHVFTRVRGAQSVKVSPDYSGPSDDTTYQYTYDLYGTRQADGSFAVSYGKWTGDSVEDHPDYVMTLPDKGVKIRHSSQNAQVDSSVVDDLISRTEALSH